MPLNPTSPQNPKTLLSHVYIASPQLGFARPCWTSFVSCSLLSAFLHSMAHISMALSSCVFCQLTQLSADADNVVLATPTHIAVLDHQPLVSSRSHILLIPRSHSVRLCDVPESELADIGPLLSLLARALGSCFDVKDYNIVQNNGPAAGQLVPHVHFHIVARSPLSTTSSNPLSNLSIGSLKDRAAYSSLIFARGDRSDLDPDFAQQSTAALRAYCSLHYPSIRPHSARL
ncbi:HIT-like domain-containing protein [Kockiozyma suomiensis]|uniref:HIT-like domain-containing protein n=1 Tax=Kockiozyma suomiensis TaxID=1337062 RepID=UPI003343E770